MSPAESLLSRGITCSGQLSDFSAFLPLPPRHLPPRHLPPQFLPPLGARFGWASLAVWRCSGNRPDIVQQVVGE